MATAGYWTIKKSHVGYVVTREWSSGLLQRMPCDRVLHSVADAMAALGEWQRLRRNADKRRFHVVAVSTTCYRLRASHATMREAADDAVLRSRMMQSAVIVRDGNTGKRYSVRELIDAGHASDNVLTMWDRIARDAGRRTALPIVSGNE